MTNRFIAGPDSPYNGLPGLSLFLRLGLCIKNEDTISRLTFDVLCRDEATRTPDPYVPNVVRYQLRYIPMLVSFWRLLRQTSHRRAVITVR